MSEHKIAQDNIDIDVDVSSTVADDQERDSAPDDTTGDVAITADRVEDGDSKDSDDKDNEDKDTTFRF